jgi:hypothetical protein
MATTVDFGDRILERKSVAGVWFATLWPAAALLGGGGAVALNASASNVSLAATTFGIAGILLLLPLFLPGRVLRFYERGLTEQLPLKALRPIPYEDVEHMKWRAARPAVGVAVNVELLAAGRRIDFHAHVDTGGRFHRQLDSLRDHIARYVAARAQRQIRASQSFAWGQQRGASVRLRQEGIAYRPVGFLGAGDERLIPWGTPLDFAVRRGSFAAFPAGGTQALFSLACESPDFYPGFVLFTSMAQPREVA